MTLSLCIWLEEKSPPGTNTSGDWSERFHFKPWYPTYLRFMGVWARGYLLFSLSVGFVIWRKIAIALKTRKRVGQLVVQNWGRCEVGTETACVR
jgi:hypothetical protein